MNKLTKLGVSALCGSLAAVSSANAGDLSVSGGVDMSWISMDDEITGNPIGIGSNYTFAGSGELDNGWTVDLSILVGNKGTFSNTTVGIAVPALGNILVSGGISGTGIDAMDDKTPNVWEEAYATGMSNGINTISGTSAGTTIQWKPNMMPDGVALTVAYSPDASGGLSNDKVSSGQAVGQGAGYDVTVELSDAITGMSGLTIFGGISNIEQSGAPNYDGDKDEETVGITYAIGGLTLGYQWSEEDLGISANEQQYENTGYGVTFAINDDLSIGYNHYESKQTSTTNVTSEASSYQIAYSMGGASIRVAEGSADNMDYQTGAAYDRDNTVISLSLAF